MRQQQPHVLLQQQRLGHGLDADEHRHVDEQRRRGTLGGRTANAGDVGFATDMIPHHAQAVQMADLALTGASNAQVKAMAAAIKAAQDPEITQMSGWLRSWARPVPSAMAGMGRMSHGTGTMSDADMTELGKAIGPGFDRLWVQMMITHHQGAISMARTELTSGRNTAAKALALSIVTSQSAEMTQLKTLLTELPTA